MKINKYTIHQFTEYVRTESKRIICFGAGTMVNACLPYALKDQSIVDFIDYIADNDRFKWDTKITVGEKVLKIISPFDLVNKVTDNTVILITSCYFSYIINQLNDISKLNNVVCVICSELFYFERISNEDSNLNFSNNSRQQIPKIIHYCWFGGNAIPENYKNCIESWKRYCPDYKIIEWNESNYDISKNKYMKQAYEAKKWGFVPDYARLDILYEYGGIYFDTDVEIVKNIDGLLYNYAFCGFEDLPMVNCGGGCGAVKGFDLIREMRDTRSNINFIKENGTFNMLTAGAYETIPLRKYGLKQDYSMQIINGMTIYPPEFFHPKSQLTGDIYITKNTCAIHHYDWSWGDSLQHNERKSTYEMYKKLRKLN